jgi:hypothetical protein
MDLPWASVGDVVKSREKAGFGRQTAPPAMVNHY